MEHRAGGAGKARLSAMASPLVFEADHRAAQGATQLLIPYDKARRMSCD